MNFLLLLPEISVAILAGCIIIIDLFVPERFKGSFPYVSIAGLSLIVVFYIFSGLPSSPSFLQNVIVVDHFTSFFRILFLLLGIGVLFASRGFVEKHIDKKGEYYALILTAVLATMLMAGARELLTAFLAIELLSFSLYVLVSITRDDQRSNESGMKYIILGVLSSALFLFGISYVYGILGTTVFDDIAQATINAPVNLGLLFGITLIIVGFGFKVAAVPFHMWAPDVYEGAPLPTTALLAALAKAAVFALFIRVFVTAFGPSISSWQTIILIIAGLTMTLGNLVALTQSNIKRLMAYSSIGQSGYMLMGIAAFSHLTISGLIFHISGYALSTIAAFFAIIVYHNQTGHEEITDYAGLAKRSPFLAISLMASLFSLAGLPFFVGFATKFYFFTAVAAEGFLWLVSLAILNSVISLYYYLQIVRQMYIEPGTETAPLMIGPTPRIVLGFLAIAITVLGIYPRFLVAGAELAARTFF